MKIKIKEKSVKVSEQTCPERRLPQKRLRWRFPCLPQPRPRHCRPALPQRSHPLSLSILKGAKNWEIAHRMTRIKDKAPGQPCGLATRRNQMSKSCAGLFFISDVTAFVEIVKYFFITTSFCKFNLLFVFSRDVMCKCFSNLFLYSATALVRYLGKTSSYRNA